MLDLARPHTGFEMPSKSLRTWRTSQHAKLDEIMKACRVLRGTVRGRRREQVIHAYAVLLSSHFQCFCRDLHSECVQYIVQSVPDALQNVVRGEFLRGRKLDRGNPNPGSVGADFGRLGLPIWDRLKALDRRNDKRRHQLEELNNWRNAIAHQVFDPVKLGGRTTLRLDDVNRWRRACEELARVFDQVARGHLNTLVGSPPW